VTAAVSILMLCFCHVVTLQILKSQSQCISKISDRCAWLSERLERVERRL